MGRFNCRVRRRSIVYRQYPVTDENGYEGEWQAVDFNGKPLHEGTFEDLVKAIGLVEENNVPWPHTYYEVGDEMSEALYRYVVEGGLAVCKVCGGAEGSLTTHCCGTRMPPGYDEKVQRGEIDFFNGHWTFKVPLSFTDKPFEPVITRKE